MQAYEQYFGFERPIFQDLLAHDDSVFHTPQSEDLARKFAVALSRRDAAVLIAGSSGSGKTTLAQDCASRTATRLASTCIDHTLNSPDELLEQLLLDFGNDSAGLSRVERLQLWRQFLAEMAATDSRICVIVENVESIDVSIMRALHELTVPHAPQFPGANIVLTTANTTTCGELLDELPALSQRIRLRATVMPLSASETNDYLDFKCELGEVSREQVFAGDIAETLHELSGGVIRVLDALVESGLALAAQSDTAPLAVATIERMAGEILGIEPMSPEALDKLLADSETGFDQDAVIPTLTNYIPAASGIPISHA